jgi:hypothetical protein
MAFADDEALHSVFAMVFKTSAPVHYRAFKLQGVTWQGCQCYGQIPKYAPMPDGKPCAIEWVNGCGAT